MSQHSADQFQVRVTWLSSLPLLVGRNYFFLIAGAELKSAQKIPGSVTRVKHTHKNQSQVSSSSSQVLSGEEATLNISLQFPLELAEPIESQKLLLSVLDENTDDVLGSGNVQFALHRATNIRWQTLTVDKTARAQAKHQQPCCIWFTGLSGSGKSTIANLLEKKLFDQGFHTYLLDGDNLRHGLNRDLGFTEADRVENIRRVAEVSKLMIDAGLIVLASFISPFASERQMARRLFNAGEFIEVFVDTPLVECERRDVKGLYAKARRGELKNFTGIDSAYERPDQAELVLDTCAQTVEQCVEKIIAYLSLETFAQ